MAAIAPRWAAAWVAGELDHSPVLRLLAGRLAGGEPMLLAAAEALPAATTTAKSWPGGGSAAAAQRVLEAVLAAPLAQTECRLLALEVRCLDWRLCISLYS